MVKTHLAAIIRDLREDDKLPLLKALLDDMTDGQADTILIHDEDGHTILYCVRAAGPVLTALEIDTMADDYEMAGSRR